MDRRSFGKYTAVRGKLASDDARAAYVIGPTPEGRIAPLASFWSFAEAARWASSHAFHDDPNNLGLTWKFEDGR